MCGAGLFASGSSRPVGVPSRASYHEETGRPCASSHSRQSRRGMCSGGTSRPRHVAHLVGTELAPADAVGGRLGASSPLRRHVGEEREAAGQVEGVLGGAQPRLEARKEPAAMVRAVSSGRGRAAEWAVAEGGARRSAPRCRRRRASRRGGDGHRHSSTSPRCTAWAAARRRRWRRARRRTRQRTRRGRGGGAGLWSLSGERPGPSRLK